MHFIRCMKRYPELQAHVCRVGVANGEVKGKRNADATEMVIIMVLTAVIHKKVGGHIGIGVSHFTHVML